MLIAIGDDVTNSIVICISPLIASIAPLRVSIVVKGLGGVTLLIPSQLIHDPIFSDSDRS